MNPGDQAICSLLERMIAEQRQTNELLIALVEGMADDDEREDMARPTYLDGQDHG